MPQAAGECLLAAHLDLRAVPLELWSGRWSGAQHLPKLWPITALQCACSSLLTFGAGALESGLIPLVRQSCGV